MNVNVKSLDAIQFKNSLKDHCSLETLVSLIQAKVKTIPLIETQKYSPELALYVANLIEQSLYDNQLTGDKAAMFLEIYKNVFDLSVQDEVIVRKLVDVFLDNGLVKLVKLEARVLTFFKRVFGLLGQSVLARYTTP